MTQTVDTPVEAQTETPQIHIPQIQVARVKVPLVGKTPLISHRWSQKAKQQMLDAQQGRKTPKQNRDPEQDYESSLYRLKDGGYGFPVLGFKSATVSAARFFGKGVSMTSLRQFLFMHGLPEDGESGQLLVRVEGEPRMREDMVRVGMGGTDLRYRAEFPEWTAELDVTYVTSALNLESVLALIDAGGLGVGVGEWRPERKGGNGTYGLDPDRDVEVIG